MPRPAHHRAFRGHGNSWLSPHLMTREPTGCFNRINWGQKKSLEKAFYEPDYYRVHGLERDGGRGHPLPRRRPLELGTWNLGRTTAPLARVHVGDAQPGPPAEGHRRRFRGFTRKRHVRLWMPEWRAWKTWTPPLGFAGEPGPPGSHFGYLARSRTHNIAHGPMARLASPSILVNGPWTGCATQTGHDNPGSRALTLPRSSVRPDEQE